MAALSQGGEQLLPWQGGDKKFWLGGGERGGNKNKIFLKFHITAKILSFTGKYGIFQPPLAARGGNSAI